MATRRLDTWYVSFEQKTVQPVRRSFSRATVTFFSEVEAKEFAGQKVLEANNVSAGTLNPHSPKRVISPAQITLWLDAP
jgi:hypothetical protein